METGTGKTYVYIKTIMELHKRYGWSKYIVVVPSIAIREGVKKSFDITAEHFQQSYGTKPRAFIYNSSRTARAGDVLLRRRRPGDDHQHPGVQLHRARTTGASTRSSTTSSPAGQSTSSPRTGRS